MIRSLLRPLLSSALLALWLAGDARGAAVTDSPIASRITSVALFKNGLGFVTREVTVPLDGAPFTLQGIPVPVHGTFWAYVPGKPAAIRSIQAFGVAVRDSFPASTPGEILAANLGRALDIHLGSGETLRGRVISAGDAGGEEADPAFPALQRNVPPAGGGLIVLESGGGRVAFSGTSVDRVSATSGILATWLERRGRMAALRVETQGASGQTLRVESLARGIAWAPSYIVELLGPDRARLIARAEIVNDLEDLRRAPVSFVTGYPNLRYAEVDDPIGLRGDLSSFLEALQGRGRAYGGVMSQMAFADEERASRPAPVVATPGQALEEMYFYGPRELSLAKGERGYYPLFELEVPCGHRYTLHPGDLLAAAQPAAEAPLREPTEDVWHSVRLENPGKVPWTTAPASAFKDGKLLAQDMLPHTPAGGRGTLHLTKALDLRAEAAESEVERKRNATSFYGYGYDLVVVRGRMSVTSFRDADVRLEITKDVTGEVLSSVPQAKADTTARGLRAVNPSSVLTWELPLKARGKLVIDYRYRILLRQ